MEDLEQSELPGQLTLRASFKRFEHPLELSRFFLAEARLFVLIFSSACTADKFLSVSEDNLKTDPTDDLRCITPELD